MKINSSQQGYWKTDGQFKWFVKFGIPLVRDFAWDYEPGKVWNLGGSDE